MEKILVMLSTYNGEHYVKTQIDSILHQTGVEVHLLVRDDGSTDGTLDILRLYRDSNENITLIEAENCGAIWSFYKLMEYASCNFPSFRYFAFSDQDDYWYPDKLRRAVESNASGSDLFFYHSCYELADKNLNVFARTSNGGVRGTLGEALISNVSIGCSEVFTYKVLSAASEICRYGFKDKRECPYHDLWVYLVALCLKADIVFDGYCGLKYRQHEHNVIGSGRSWKDTLLFQIKNMYRLKNQKSHFAKILSDIVVTDSDIREILALPAGYRRSLAKRFRLVFSRHFRISGMTRKLGFVYCVLFGLY